MSDSPKELIRVAHRAGDSTRVIAEQEGCTDRWVRALARKAERGLAGDVSEPPAFELRVPDAMDLDPIAAVVRCVAVEGSRLPERLDVLPEFGRRWWSDETQMGAAWKAGGGRRARPRRATERVRGAAASAGAGAAAGRRRVGA